MQRFVITSAKAVAATGATLLLVVGTVTPATALTDSAADRVVARAAADDPWT
ncbi:hypothetical protein [Streptomyces sp. SID14515]|uniref:hypothetical protein n=1 Tax=Streptomyces sp. SID14515 TaxID=2706074 RepID=UPI0013C688BC|nr:hypothetical protein [Streptomyces sp. SID14515]NEB42203.1 hypothetical protein [Streptomyces sp. SID14515]